MILDILAAAAAALSLFWSGYATARMRKEPEKKPDQIEASKPVCGCGHHYAVHGDDGVCTSITQGVVSREPKVMKTGYEGEDHEVHYVEKFEQIPCPCKRYTGPEPLPSYYS